MHPTGLEPASKASEAYVLSIRLRVPTDTQMLQFCYILIIISQVGTIVQ